jgi:single-stranded-DNA-specific exonuclease
MAQREGGEEITLSNSDIAGVCASIDPRSGITDSGVSTGVSIFRELGLVDSFGYGSARTLVIRPDAGKVDLESSTRYREGMGQLDEFRTFREWVLGASPDELLSAFNHPILPG